MEDKTNNTNRSVIKLVLILAGVALSNHHIFDRLAYFIDGKHYFALAVFLGIWFLTLLAVLYAAFTRNRGAQTIWTILICFSTLIGDTYFRLSGRQISVGELDSALERTALAAVNEIENPGAVGLSLADLINQLSGTGGDGVSRLVIPVAGTLTSRFGPRWGRLHGGIDIAASTGTPIRAAAAGTTIYSAWMSGYGNVVIVDHGGGMSTLYAHQSRRRTAVGDRLNRGEVLGEVGSTGNSTGAHLHFEVREQGVAADPLPYLSS